MVDEALDDKKFDITNNKVIYSLSFILMLWILKDFIISFFPVDFYLDMLSLKILPSEMLNYIIIILFLSIYLYGVNYIFVDQLSGVKIWLNRLADFLWFLFFFSPLILILSIIITALVESPEILVGLTVLVSTLLTSIFTFGFERKSMSISLFLLDKQLELLKLEKPKDGLSVLFKNYMILEVLVKKLLIEKKGIPTTLKGEINLSGAANLLRSTEIIDDNMVHDLRAAQELRNGIVHGKTPVSRRDIKRIKDIILKLESLLRSLKE